MAEHHGVPIPEYLDPELVCVMSIVGRAMKRGNRAAALAALIDYFDDVEFARHVLDDWV